MSLSRRRTQRHLAGERIRFFMYAEDTVVLDSADNLQTPDELVPKIFEKLRTRYADRPGGYTRVLRIEPIKEDQAPSAILELLDGPKDMRFAMTAKTLASMPPKQKMNDITAKNVKKVTQFREHGMSELRGMIEKMRNLNTTYDDSDLPAPRRVYPETQDKMKRRHYP